MGAKFCLGCNKLLDLQYFYKHPSGAQGHLARCKDCVLARYHAGQKLSRRHPKYSKSAAAKTCLMCEEEKPLADFRKKRQCQLGVDTICIECRLEYNLRYKTNLPLEQIEKARLRERSWRLEKRAAGLCISCGDIPAIENRVRCQPCLDRRAEVHQRWLARRGSNGSNYCVDCGDPCNAKSMRCWDCSVKKRGIRRVALTKPEIWQQIFDLYGDSCRCCGETTKRLLTVDHINNDGKHDRGDIYRYIRNGKRDDLQILCMNCNWGRMLNGGICPHQENNLTTELL